MSDTTTNNQELLSVLRAGRKSVAQGWKQGRLESTHPDSDYSIPDPEDKANRCAIGGLLGAVLHPRRTISNL